MLLLWTLQESENGAFEKSMVKNMESIVRKHDEKRMVKTGLLSTL